MIITGHMDDERRSTSPHRLWRGCWYDANLRIWRARCSEHWTMSTDCSEYRDHIVEVTLFEEAGGRWQGDWAVFQRQPFVAVGAGMFTFQGNSRTDAQETARRRAAAWVDHFIDAAGPAASASPDEIL